MTTLMAISIIMRMQLPSLKTLSLINASYFPLCCITYYMFICCFLDVIRRKSPNPKVNLALDYFLIISLSSEEVAFISNPGHPQSHMRQSFHFFYYCQYDKSLFRSVRQRNLFIITRITSSVIHSNCKSIIKTLFPACPFQDFITFRTRSAETPSRVSISRFIM